MSRQDKTDVVTTRKEVRSWSMAEVQIEGPQGLMGKEEEVTIIAQIRGPRNGWFRSLTVLFYFVPQEISRQAGLARQAAYI